MIIVVVTELLFQEAIELAVTGENSECLVISDDETLQAALQETNPEVILMDIGLSTLDGPSLVQKLKQNPSTRAIPLVVFGNQLRADLMQDAQEAGADLVLPKSAFREQLPEIIRHYVKNKKK
jgi:CheY-like chemotaxis protein